MSHFATKDNTTLESEEHLVFLVLPLFHCQPLSSLEYISQIPEARGWRTPKRASWPPLDILLTVRSRPHWRLSKDKNGRRRDHTSLRPVSFFRCPNKQHCHLQASSPDSPYTLQLVTKSTIHWLLRCSLSQALLITGNVCSPQVAPRQSRVLATHWTTWNPQSKADSRIEAASPLPPLLQFCCLTMMIRAPPCHSVWIWI